jgi:hypothetical protein
MTSTTQSRRVDRGNPNACAPDEVREGARAGMAGVLHAEGFGRHSPSNDARFGRGIGPR